MKTHTEVMINNEKVTSHLFLKQEKKFNPSNPSTLDQFSKSKIPQALEMVNQTVSIAAEPEQHRYFRKNLLEYPAATAEQV